MTFTAPLLHNLIYILTESQKWSQIQGLLTGMNKKSCTDPDRKTMTYIKRNLVYCFDQQTRSGIKDQIERFENEFF